MGSNWQAQMARERWELENNVEEISASDALFAFDEAANTVVLQRKPWAADPHYFKQ